MVEEPHNQVEKHEYSLMQDDDLGLLVRIYGRILQRESKLRDDLVSLQTALNAFGISLVRASGRMRPEVGEEAVSNLRRALHVRKDCEDIREERIRYETKFRDAGVGFLIHSK